MEEEDLFDFEQDDEETASKVYLLSPFYGYQHKDCLLCVYQYLPQFKSQISRFESMLDEANSKLGCGIKTCIHLVLKETQNDESMGLFHQISACDISEHFDSVFGHPMCGYNRLKRYNFFSLFDENTVDSASYTDFVYNTYKHSRTTSLCPYALLCVYVFVIMMNTIGGVTEFKKKHDFLWMYNSLCNHKIRLGKLQ